VLVCVLFATVSVVLIIPRWCLCVGSHPKLHLAVTTALQGFYIYAHRYAYSGALLSRVPQLHSIVLCVDMPSLSCIKRPSLLMGACRLQKQSCQHSASCLWFEPCRHGQAWLGFKAWLNYLIDTAVVGQEFCTVYQFLTA